jgi:two-component system alkaline phosphatase synthesis response regulator PhoP/two-component system response regulator VicR
MRPEASRCSPVPRARKRLRVLILEAGVVDRPFYTILAANVQRWGYEAVVCSTEGMSTAGGRWEIEGDILLYDMDAPLQPVVVWGDAQTAALVDVEHLVGQQTWPKVRLVIALSSRSVSRHSLEKVGAIAFLHKPFDMRYLERYLRVFQKLLFMESAEIEEALERGWQRGRRQATVGILPTYRILVADDRRDVTGIIRQCLVEQGRERSRYEVRETHDGLELLEQCLLWRPHCVVTDVLMPWLNGYQVMRCLADCTRQPMPVFVVISALMQHELPVNRSYVREPVVLYVDKPFDVENVLTVIEQALAR